MTIEALRAVPVHQMDDLKKKRDEDEDSNKGSEIELHPDVAPFAPFKYKPGKPDRMKKVQRFFTQEEAKMLKSVE